MLRKVPVVFAHPVSSHLWRTAECQLLLSLSGVQRVSLSCCDEIDAGNPCRAGDIFLTFAHFSLPPSASPNPTPAPSSSPFLSSLSCSCSFGPHTPTRPSAGQPRLRSSDLYWWLASDRVSQWFFGLLHSLRSSRLSSELVSRLRVATLSLVPLGPGLTSLLRPGPVHAVHAWFRSCTLPLLIPPALSEVDLAQRLVHVPGLKFDDSVAVFWASRLASRDGALLISALSQVCRWLRYNYVSETPGDSLAILPYSRDMLARESSLLEEALSTGKPVSALFSLQTRRFLSAFKEVRRKRPRTL